MKTISDFNFKDKKALVRVDFNVPQDDQLKVTDNTRISAVKPTVEKILNDGGSVILMTHLGRPKGEVKDEFSLKHIVEEGFAGCCNIPQRVCIRLFDQSTQQSSSSRTNQYT